MTCGECNNSRFISSSLIPHLRCKLLRPEFQRPDLPAERCPCFDRKEEK